MPKPLQRPRLCPTRRWKSNSYLFVRAGARTGEELMNRRTTSMLAGAVIAASPAIAADVTPERLINADREPQNWLMNHRTYDSQRYSPLDQINKANVKSLKIAYAVAIGGTSANENLEATPLAEDGFLYLISPISGACCIRLTAARAIWAGSCGAWTRAGEDRCGESWRRAVG